MTILVVLSLLFLLSLEYRAHRRRIAAQRAARRLGIARLTRHADEEVELVENGDMAGVFGSYSPAPGMRNVGMKAWIQAASAPGEGTTNASSV